MRKSKWDFFFFNFPCFYLFFFQEKARLNYWNMKIQIRVLKVPFYRMKKNYYFWILSHDYENPHYSIPERIRSYYEVTVFSSFFRWFEKHADVNNTSAAYRKGCGFCVYAEKKYLAEMPAKKLLALTLSIRMIKLIHFFSRY